MKTLYDADLHMRSPTSLGIALLALRRARNMDGLAQALHMEFGIAVAHVVSLDVY